MTQEATPFGVWPPPPPPTDRVTEPTPMPALPQWVPAKIGAVQGVLIWSGAHWTWQTGLKRDGYQWNGRDWVDPRPDLFSKRTKTIAIVAAATLFVGLMVVPVVVNNMRSTSPCQPATAFQTQGISQLLQAYPELGIALNSTGAQSVPYGETVWAATEFRDLVAGRLSNGEIGLWALAYNGTNDAFMGPFPLNTAAISASPDAGSYTQDAASIVRDIAASPSGQAAVGCVN